jgi:hypothetical protein
MTICANVKAKKPQEIGAFLLDHSGESLRNTKEKSVWLRN